MWQLPGCNVSNLEEIEAFSPGLARFGEGLPRASAPNSSTLKETSAKGAFSVAAVYDRRKTPIKIQIRRSQSAATGVLQRSLKGLNDSREWRCNLIVKS
jgi:hypothetical protein